MTIAEAQAQCRAIFIGGFYGQLVSAGIWFASAALYTWRSPTSGIVAAVVGGIFIYPITQLSLRAAGHKAWALPAENPLRELGFEIAMLVPLLLPLVGAATLHRADWFYPSLMIVVGAHYFPFAFLYGMRQFVGLAAALFAPGFLVGLYAPQLAVAGAWFTVAALIVFACTGRLIVRAEARRA